MTTPAVLGSGSKPSRSRNLLAPERSALLLLSGGLDSVAALHWARAAFGDVRALSCDYGQANRDAELGAAQAIAHRRGVPWDGLHLADAVRGFASLKPAAPGLVLSGQGSDVLQFLTQGELLRLVIRKYERLGTRKDRCSR